MAQKGGKQAQPEKEVPQSLRDAANFIARIGELQRQVRTIELETNERIENIKAEAADRAEPLIRGIKELRDSVYFFAATHEDELTLQGKRRTIDVSAGTLGWRTTPPAVRITNTKEVLAALNSLGLRQFIRTREEIDKQAMLKDPQTASQVPGVSISQREEFVIVPAETDIVETKKLTRKRLNG